MTNRNKNEKEKAEWQLALDLQEKKILDGMKEACNSISENLKSFYTQNLKKLKQK